MYVHCAMLCYVPLCYAILCSAVLCYVMSCYIMLCMHMRIYTYVVCMHEFVPIYVRMYAHMCVCLYV